MDILSVKNAKMIDKYSIETMKIPSIVLMENAGLRISDLLINKANNFTIICGVGNNGGDGLVIARHLLNNKKKVNVVIVGDLLKATVDFKTNFEILLNLKCNIAYIKEKNDIDNQICSLLKDSEIIVDCLFGVGLNRNVEGIYYDVILTINSISKYVVAVDIPSGLNADTGKPLGICIKADQTFTIQVPKKGFYEYESFDYVGELNIIDIGIPKEAIDNYNDNIIMLDDLQYKDMIPVRKVYGHKGNYGKVLVWAGSLGLTGAAYITTQSIVKSGAGLVTLIVDDNTSNILASKLTEAMTINIKEKYKISKLLKDIDVFVCGPGIGKTEESKNLLSYFLENTTCKLVLDADAINILSENKELFKYLKGRAILTPHHGEMARLIGEDINYVNNNRFKVCKEFAKKYDIVLLLKGYHSLISDGDRMIINPTGNSKMASGGMGDCLTGIITGVLAQKKELFKSAILGCYLHGKVADELSKERYNVIATDIINNLSQIINDIVCCK